MDLIIDLRPFWDKLPCILGAEIKNFIFILSSRVSYTNLSPHICFSLTVSKKENQPTISNTQSTVVCKPTKICVENRAR
jgi:hypothetical protein